MIDVNKPVSNPDLLEAIKAMKLEGSMDRLNEVINEVLRARFLSPVTIRPEPESDENGNSVFREDTTISFHLIDDGSGASYFPAFSNWEELRKWNAAEQMQTLVSGFDDYATMILDKNAENQGFVIDPYGSNLLFTYEMIDSLKQQKEKLKGGITAHTVEKDTKVLLGQPSEYPTEMVNSVSDYFKTQKGVEKAYFMLMIKEATEESSYLLVIDYKGDSEDILGGIAKAAEPHLNGKYLDMVPFETDFGRKATERAEPFYRRKRFKIFA